ncbi:hypothetical protein STEG23_027045 [Scotinomys teguina]
MSEVKEDAHFSANVRCVHNSFLSRQGSSNQNINDSSQTESHHPQSALQQFRNFCYNQVPGPREAASKLQELCYQWLMPETNSKKQILEALVLEQFLNILSQAMKNWVQKHHPEAIKHAVALAECLQTEPDAVPNENLLTFEDTEMHFSREDWCLLDPSQKTLYKDVMLNIYKMATSLVQVILNKLYMPYEVEFKADCFTWKKAEKAMDIKPTFQKVLPVDTQTARSMLSLEARERLFTLIEDLPKDNGEPENKAMVYAFEVFDEGKKAEKAMDIKPRKGTSHFETEVGLVSHAHMYLKPGGRVSHKEVARKKDNSTFKSVRGIVTTLSTEYGWINESIFFNPDMVCGNVPVNVGMSVIVLVEEDETSHAIKTVRVKAVSDAIYGIEPSEFDKRLCIKIVTYTTRDNIYISEETFFPMQLFSGGFLPFKGDLLLVEYSWKPGTSNITVHAVSFLNSQNMDEDVLWTRVRKLLDCEAIVGKAIGGTTGVVDDVIFFALESVQKPLGYTPRLYDIMNVVAVDSIQQHCSLRAVAMNPVEMCID